MYRYITLTLVLVVALVLTACGINTADNTADNTVETTQEPATSTETPTATTPLDNATAVIDVAYFDSADLVSDPQIVDCTLQNGVATQCAEFVTKYLPDNLEIGPFCPDTIYDEGGIWDWDGDEAGLYRLDEAFFTMLTAQGYEFYDADGNVYIGDPAGQLIAGVNNCLEATADESVEITVRIPLEPMMAASATDLGTVAQVGLGIDGVPIFADAPSVLQTGHLPALDECGGHIDPGGWYHWHATTTDIDSSFAYEGVDVHCHLDQSATALFAFAFDGYPIYGSVDQDGSTPTDLDECSGHSSATAEYPDGVYHYHAGLEFPNLPSCLMGVSAENAFATTASAGVGATGGRGPGGPGNPPNGAPNDDDSDDADDSSSEVEETDGTTSVVNLDVFDSAGLVQDPAVVDCTLTDGTETQCAQLVVKYVPDDFETGPFCPETLADVGGIWNWDGDNPGLYRLNEAFWTMVSEQGFIFYDEEGNINIEDPGPAGPTAVLDGNNCIEIAQDETAEITMLIPLNPVMAENPTRLGVVSQVGLSLNSIPIFSDAPSVFVTNNLPALDPCGGHVDPGGWYHWHATATDIESSFEHEGVEAECHLAQSASELFGYAFDGYPLYGSADADGTLPTDLDACNGHTAITADYPDGIYHYHATLEFPNLPTCLMGTLAEDALHTNASGDTGAPDGNAPASGPPGGAQNGPPDFSGVAEALGITEEELNNALGTPPFDLEASADALGITLEELEVTLDAAGVQLVRP